MLTAIGDVMREAYKRNWISTRDGNISVRQGNVFYITPSGCIKHQIHPDDILRIKIPPNKKLKDIDSVGMSIEADMHWRLIMSSPKIKSVVHLHPTFCVSAMHAGWQLKDVAKKFVELSRYTNVGDNVPWCPPGSEDLASLTYSNLAEYGKYDIVGQVDHGVTSVGKNPWHAFEHIERMEHVCQILLASGVKPND